ncbi:hypothetical protein [Hymenobacter sp. CRA2]|uniref:hypothetical protein n=1 Tax=Hymenobacter sp. CRA2 TaxID=1955620 RepID=UPI00098FD66D|nr:hypothetical protein [Hymenobacter sp. CRA2]OON69983.1 hypothetical protein B0919_04340 [Hymenobacter sp. CRA2]
MKRFLLVAALSTAALFASHTDAQAQRTDSTYVKPQLPTGPPALPPTAPPTRPPQTTQPQQPVQQVPTQPQQPTRPPGGIDDDGRSAQPLPGSRPQQPAAAPTQRPGGGIDDDGRPAQTLPQNGTVPGATVQQEYQPSKYFIYGNLSLGLTSNYVGGVFYNVGASPALGYRLNSRVAVGPGLVYSHSAYTIPSRSRAPGTPKNITGNNLGLKVFGQVIVYKQFFIHAEYEVTKAEIISEAVAGNQVFVGKTKATVRTPLLGAGYRQQLGDKFATDIAILYNFNDGLDNNIYGQPVIRFSLLYDLGK